MRRISALVATLALAFTACSGDSVSGQAQTEEGAIQAVKASTGGALKGNSGAVLNFLSDECRSAIDEDELRLTLALIPAFFNDLFEFDIDEIEIEPEVVSFDGDTARVKVAYLGPDGTEIDDIGFSSETIDIMYDGTKWVDTDCDFEDTTERDAEALAEALAELGYAGTRDDPIPASVGAPVGSGFTVSIDDVNTDAAAAIEAMGGFVSEPDPGFQFVLVSVTVGFSGSEEPEAINGLSTQIIGGSDSIGYDSFGCGSFPTQLGGSGQKLFSGGVVTGDLCFPVKSTEIDGMLLSIQGGFGLESPTFFDPNRQPDSPVPVTGSTGPDPDGDFTPARQSPTPLGTPVDVGDGWTLTINGFTADATAEILAASDFNDAPPPGFVYSLLDHTLTFDGDDEPGSAFSVGIDLVGDSNVTAGDCSVSEVPNRLDRFADVFKGGSLSGVECYLVAESDLDSLVVVAEADFFSDDQFVLAVR